MRPSIFFASPSPPLSHKVVDMSGRPLRLNTLPVSEPMQAIAGIYWASHEYVHSFAQTGILVGLLWEF